MAKRGGSATVYGVLYQMLGSIRWATQFQLRGTVDDEDLQSATLILEPRDGGDIQIDLPNKRIVEQWKSRSTGRKWTLREIIGQVLPDLYRSVNPNRLAEPAVYRFVTEGGCADWSTASELFAWMAQQPLPDDPLAVLDDSQPKTFFSRREAAQTDRAFFEYVLAVVAPPDATGDTETTANEAARCLWHLLSGFEIRSDQSKAGLERDIDVALRNYVDYPVDDVPDKRIYLCGLVLELASRGETLTPTQFFQMAGLDPKSLKNWRSVFAELCGQTRIHLRDRLHYAEVFDVRPPSGWPATRPIIVISGESGQGKTWRLAAYGNLHGFEGATVAAVRATGNARETICEVADFIWKAGFGRQREMSLDGIAASLMSCADDLSSPWLVVLIDEVRSDEEARRLIEFPWEQHGMRAALVVPQHLAEPLGREHFHRVAMDSVADFAPRELREYLRRRGLSWGELPGDMRQFLLRPLLAHLYCSLAKERRWLSANEYLLFEAVWEQIRTKHPGAPDDAACLLELVGATLEGRTSYPWTVASCQQFAIDRDAIQRLVDAGWMDRENTRIRIWHTRLLNWAVAAALTDRFRQDVPKTLDLIGRVLSESVLAGEPLAYVPMDLLWMTSDPNACNRAQSHRALSVIEERCFKTFEQKQALFGGLVPTLGERVIEPLVAFFREKSTATWRYESGWLTQALVRIAAQSPTHVQAQAVRMLGDDCLGIQESAVRVLRHLPTPDALHGLWRVFERVRSELGDASDEAKTPRQLTRGVWKTISACAVQRPTWIADKIEENLHDPTILAELAGVLAEVDHPEAEQVWERTRRQLCEGLGSGDCRLASCIDRFADRGHFDLLEAWVRQQHVPLAGVSLAALASVDPDRAIGTLDFAFRTAMVHFRDTWLPVLLSTRPKATLEKLRGMMGRSIADAAEVGGVFADQTWWLDPPTVEVLVQTALSLLGNVEAKPGAAHPDLQRALRLLAQVTDLRLLESLRIAGGPDLHSLLVAAATSWAASDARCEPELQIAMRVLLRIQASGLTQVVNTLLASPSKAKRLEGLSWCLMSPDQETLSLVRRIAVSDEANDGTIPDVRALLHDAVDALALLGHDHALIETALRREVDVLGTLELRLGQNPMSDAAIKPALDALDDADEERRALAAMALGLSGRRDLIPRLLEILKQVDVESRLAFGAIVGLAGLRADQDEAIKVFEQHLTIANHRFIAANGLFRSERPDAREILLRDLQQNYADNPFGLDERIAVVLTRYPETRDGAIALITRHAIASDEFRNMFRSAEFLDLLSQVNDGFTDDMLRSEADPLEVGPYVVGRRARAIRALAARDREAAFDSAQRALIRGKNDRQLFPDIVVELDADRAVPMLCEQFKTETQALVCRGIGLALRRSGQTTTVSEHVVRWLEQGNAAERRRAAQLAAWMPQPFIESDLRRRLSSERMPRVRRAIWEALLRYAHQRNAAEVLARLPHAEGVALWSYIDILFDLVDPAFLGNSRDPLWIGPALDTMPVACRRRVNELHRRRQEQIKNDLEYKATE